MRRLKYYLILLSIAWKGRNDNMINRKERQEIAGIIAVCINSVEDTRNPYEILGEIEARLRRVINATRKDDK